VLLFFRDIGGTLREGYGLEFAVGNRGLEIWEIVNFFLISSLSTVGSNV